MQGVLLLAFGLRSKRSEAKKQASKACKQRRLCKGIKKKSKGGVAGVRGWVKTLAYPGHVPVIFYIREPDLLEGPTVRCRQIQM
jgi:hypothetical protein